MKIVLGVSGSIAAYKAAEIVRRFRDRGDEVRVVFTRSAEKFVAPLTFSVLSGNPVLSDMFASSRRASRLAGRISCSSLPPADILARLAQGFADDFLSTALGHRGLVLAPAISLRCGNIRRSRNVRSSGSGRPHVGVRIPRVGTRGQAHGRPDEIVEASVFRASGDLAGLHVLVTGPAERSMPSASSRTAPRKDGTRSRRRARARGADVVL